MKNNTNTTTSHHTTTLIESKYYYRSRRSWWRGFWDRVARSAERESFRAHLEAAEPQTFTVQRDDNPPPRLRLLPDLPREEMLYEVYTLCPACAGEQAPREILSRLTWPALLKLGEVHRETNFAGWYVRNSAGAECSLEEILAAHDSGEGVELPN